MRQKQKEVGRSGGGGGGKLKQLVNQQTESGAPEGWSTYSSKGLTKLESKFQAVLTPQRTLSQRAAPPNSLHCQGKVKLS